MISLGFSARSASCLCSLHTCLGFLSGLGYMNACHVIDIAFLLSQSYRVNPMVCSFLAWECSWYRGVPPAYHSLFVYRSTSGVQPLWCDDCRYDDYGGDYSQQAMDLQMYMLNHVTRDLGRGRIVRYLLVIPVDVAVIPNQPVIYRSSGSKKSSLQQETFVM